MPVSKPTYPPQDALQPDWYFAVSAGVALVHGESAAMLKNERGVTMELETKVRGLRFNIATSGLRIALAGEQGCAAMQAHQ